MDTLQTFTNMLKNNCGYEVLHLSINLYSTENHFVCILLKQKHTSRTVMPFNWLFSIEILSEQFKLHDSCNTLERLCVGGSILSLCEI